MTKLFLVRQGQSWWSLENRFTGSKDVDIAELGKDEAREAGIHLKDEKIDLAFTSKLIRAQHTLDIILEIIGKKAIPVKTDIALNERSYGDLEGLNKAETVEKFGAEQVRIWRRSFDIAPPGGESLKDTFERVIPYFEHFIKPQLVQHKNVLIVAHGNSLRALIMHLENLTPDEMVHREIASGEPLTYTFDEQMNVIKLGKFLMAKYNI